MINLHLAKDLIKKAIQKSSHLEIKQLLILIIIIILKLLSNYLKLLQVKLAFYIEEVIPHKKIQVLRNQVI